MIANLDQHHNFFAFSIEIRNSSNKTALDLAIENDRDVCKEMLEQAMRREKSAFDHINTDWNLPIPFDDGS
jgi:hypothetical protein